MLCALCSTYTVAYCAASVAVWFSGNSIDKSVNLAGFVIKTKCSSCKVVTV